MKPVEIVVNDKMQQGYRYVRTIPVGTGFDPRFKPELTPPELLELGVFGGKYMTDCQAEFPASWFAKARLSPERHNPALNHFGVEASTPLSYWIENKWVYHADPRGWFQWYCRYFMGRRCPDDERQIKRWIGIRRHVQQLRNNSKPGDLTCRKRQRQALLHWAYDSRKI